MSLDRQRCFKKNGNINVCSVVQREGRWKGEKEERNGACFFSPFTLCVPLSESQQAVLAAVEQGTCLGFFLSSVSRSQWGSDKRADGATGWWWLGKATAKKKKGKRSACPKFKAWYSLRVIPTLLDSVVCKWHRNQQSERLSFSVRLTGHDRSWKGWGYISQLCWCQHEQSEFDIPE